MKLREIGFSRNEEKVYKALLRIGPSSASVISKEASVPYGRIYTILDSLETKGLVRVIPEKTKLFAPSPLKAVQEYLEEKQSIFNELKTNIKNYEEQNKQNLVNPVEIVKGKKNFYKLLRDIPKAKKYEYTIKYNFEVQPEFQREVDRIKKEKIDYKVLGRIDNETEENVDQWKKITKKIKPIKNNGVALSIIDDQQLLITLIKSNATLLIKDKPFILLLKELFANYYKHN